MRILGTERARRVRHRVMVLLFLVAAFWMTGCGEEGKETGPLPGILVKLKGTPAGETVLRAIQAHGGWGNWSKLKSTEYEFHWTPYTPDGAPGMTESERHRFLLTGEIRSRIDRPHENLIMAYNGLVAWVMRGGVMSQDLGSRGAAQVVLQRIHWMFQLPFNFTEVSVRLEDGGEGRGLKRINVTYTIGFGTPTDDSFQAYFDEKTGLLRELLMISSQGQVLMEFSDYRDVDGIQVAHRRRAFAVTDTGTRGQITHEVNLRNVRFNVVIDPDIYDPPEPLQDVSSLSVPPFRPAG